MLTDSGRAVSRPVLFDAVLLDRDGTLVEDVPYNADPDKVRPMPGVRAALDRLRAAGLKLAVVTNQSGLARGCSPTGRCTWCTAGSRPCSGPSTPGRCARTTTGTAARVASRDRDSCTPPPGRWAPYPLAAP
ncbi:hypothetical protein GCM10029963_20940 [Micromonospora andamanensis]